MNVEFNQNKKRKKTKILIPTNGNYEHKETAKPTDVSFLTSGNNQNQNGGYNQGYNNGPMGGGNFGSGGGGGGGGNRRY